MSSHDPPGPLPQPTRKYLHKEYLKREVPIKSFGFGGLRCNRLLITHERNISESKLVKKSFAIHPHTRFHFFIDWTSNQWDQVCSTAGRV
ncbi:hypothetical protein J4Q44_G00210720 [Coregonus suidteri]|uniref:Uncharacterized protein n=1 Tax=Coregonus suidteri TaxID=861788 RepID=A0AAN8LTE3_9TELE